MAVDWLWPVAVAPIAGSVAGVLARRLPRGEPVVLARSACEHCGTTLGAPDLVPLLSYVALRGRCRHCAAPIGRFHPAMELAALGIAGWAAMAFSGDALWASCVLGWMLLTLTVCDVASFRLPDALTLPLLLFGLAATWWLIPEAIADRALAAALGYVAFRSVAVLYRRLRGRDGLGQGDAKLLAASGAWVGLAGLPYVLLGGVVAGLLFAGAMALRGQRLSARTRIPFGPCLAIATWLIWLYM